MVCTCRSGMHMPPSAAGQPRQQLVTRAPAALTVWHRGASASVDEHVLIGSTVDIGVPRS